MTHTEMVEKWAMKLAVGNNGGQWDTHYVEEQKNKWHMLACELIAEMRLQLMREIPNEI